MNTTKCDTNGFKFNYNIIGGNDSLIYPTAYPGKCATIEGPEHGPKTALQMWEEGGMVLDELAEELAGLLD